MAGYMTCFSTLHGGGLVLLMLQYVTGGKWGLLLRRPLEAMTRTLPLVALMGWSYRSFPCSASICISGCAILDVGFH